MKAIIVKNDDFNRINGKRKYYAPSDTFEYYHPDSDTWYNSAGQQLRDPSEYDCHSEGYTPFGDE